MEFSVQPHAGLEAGAEIRNSAGIVFDLENCRKPTLTKSPTHDV